MDHTSGAQRAAAAEVIAEQLAERERRLRRRVDELARELATLATAGAAHGTRYGGAVAGGAGEARDVLRRLGHALDNGPLDAEAQFFEGVTHTVERDLEWGQSSTHGAVFMGATETRSIITPDRGDEPPFAAELVVDRPPHER